MKSRYSLSHQPSLSNINQNVNSMLGISSQYDFEKGVLINVPIQFPEVKKNPSQKPPKLIKHQDQIDKFFVVSSKHPAKSKDSSRQKKPVPYQLIKVQPPPLGYYNCNASYLNQKSIVDMSKQSSFRMQLKKMKSNSVEQVEPLSSKVKQELQNQNQTKRSPPKIAKLSNLKLQQWIQRELEQFKETKKFEQTTYKGSMSDEKIKSDNFQRLVEITSLRSKNSYAKFFF
ncbi:unnamed protein product (macronuclear) [Paramecium tetraurelia]|uniref:Enkurin domain-containing protein n=1 Tax=Paramecium tetraurelia TaxID=5888 RepID=A0CDY2_PARTE|nr:uncharacterized protein GSPATT00007211001 [Paramecium tetraurelia]CAK68999.1 unnamed protein product [Paramecium tetraurelia]|eukprot:XP_001436396.1 hypothetical protein (macronuclear) [Paramecium tetraurelia strain d4-2]